MLILTFVSLGLWSNTVNIASSVAPELFANIVCDLLCNISKVIIWNAKAVTVLKVNSMHETHSSNPSISRLVPLALSIT